MLLGDDFWDDLKPHIFNALDNYGPKVLDYIIPGVGTAIKNSGVTT